jgi:hypothetical protein
MTDDLPASLQFAEEFEKLVEKLRNRGDAYLGRYLADVLEDYTGTVKDLDNHTAASLLDAVEEFEKQNCGEEFDEACVACGDVADSAQELEKLIEKKKENAKDF